MARSARFDLPDWGAFHVTARGVAGCAIYDDDSDRFRFLRFMRLATTIASWRLLAYCLMTNHFHLVVLDELHLGNACVYVLENAHRAGLCAPSEVWPWAGGEYA